METPLDPPSQQDLQNALKTELAKQQDVFYGIVGGLAAALVGAIIWAVITVATKYQIGYMAIGVGLMTGFSVRFFGSGIDKSFGVIGAACALFGCVLGNLLSQIGFVANEESMGYFEVISLLNFEIIGNLLTDTFSPMDLFFYAIAAYEGFRFGFKNIDEELEKAIAAGKVAPPQFSEYRRPIAIGLFIFLAVLGYFLTTMEEGVRNYKYESGALQSSGAMKDGRETGAWTYWYENGQKEMEGTYVSGRPDGTWTYYDENGKITSKGSFKDGMKEGEWVQYHSDSIVGSKGKYVYDREEGAWIYNYGSGKPEWTGSFMKGLRMGEWISYYENGNVSLKGSYNGFSRSGLWTSWNEDGVKKLELEFIDDTNFRWLNSWSDKGQAEIVNGNGIRNNYVDGKLTETGSVKDGYSVGVWKTFYPDGKTRSVGEYKDKVFYLKDYWSEIGVHTVVNGNGTHTVEESGLTMVGKIENGLSTGVWTSTYLGSDQVQVERAYLNGKANGMTKNYSENGTLIMEGSMVDDKYDGVWKWYKGDGSIESEARFVNGKKEGDQTFYNAYGDILKIESYKEGKLVATNVGGVGALPAN